LLSIDGLLLVKELVDNVAEGLGYHALLRTAKVALDVLHESGVCVLADCVNELQSLSPPTAFLMSLRNALCWRLVMARILAYYRLAHGVRHPLKRRRDQMLALPDLALLIFPGSCGSLGYSNPVVVVAAAGAVLVVVVAVDVVAKLERLSAAPVGVLPVLAWAARGNRSRQLP